jgi:hypothetical protein
MTAPVSLEVHRLNIDVEGAWHPIRLQPLVYEHVRSKDGMHAIITAPHEELLDVILPLGVRYARHVVCCQAPERYLTHAHSIRVHYLRVLLEQGRIHVIPAATRKPGQATPVWILVFATEAMKRFMLRNPLPTDGERLLQLLPSL